MNVTWPINDNAVISKITLRDFSDRYYNHHYEGDWALFKLLNGSFSTMSEQGTQNIWKTELGGHRASFVISHAGPLNALHLMDLSQFHLPKKLS